MADRRLHPDTPDPRARWGGFAFTPEWDAKAKAAIARYPAGRQRSAVMALLDYAQRQVGEETQTQGWLPLPVMEYVATYLDTLGEKLPETLVNQLQLAKSSLRS